MADGVLIQAKGNPARTQTVSERDAKILVRLGRWEYQTTAIEAGPPPKRKRAAKPKPVEENEEPAPEAPTDPEPAE